MRLDHPMKLTVRQGSTSAVTRAGRQLHPEPTARIVTDSKIPRWGYLEHRKRSSAVTGAPERAARLAGGAVAVPVVGATQICQGEAQASAGAAAGRLGGAAREGPRGGVRQPR